VDDLLPPLLGGLASTLWITAGATALAVPAALVAGVGRSQGPRSVRWLCAAYVETFRGTSALVQLFWVYYALPLVGVDLGRYAAAILVLGLHIGAYGAEVVRGAIEAVPRGQWEAAQALGFTPAQRLVRVVLPQAVPAMLPPWGNLQIELMKLTALAALVGIHDLLYVADKILRPQAMPRVVEILGLTLLVYFVVAQAMAAGMRALERRAAAASERGSVTP